MRNREMKVLTGTMLSLLISAVSVLPAMARPTGESEQLLKQVQTEPNRDQPGQQPNPRQQDLQGDPTLQNQNPPARQTGQPANQMQMNQQRQSTDQLQTDRTVRGTIRVLDEDRVTLETPDGVREDIVIRPEDVTRLGLKPGMDVTFTVGPGNVAENLSVAGEENSATTDTTRTTTRQERVIQQRRTVETRPTTTRQAPTTTQQTAPESEQQPAATDTGPVRALW